MRVTELEKENEELRERIDRMEAELNALRTAPSNEFGNRQHPQSQSSPEQQLASPAPSGGVNCETCVVGKDCACLNASTIDTTEASVSASQISNAASERANEDRCGLCSSSSCLCEDLGIRNTSSQLSERSSLDSPIQGTKRKRSNLRSPPLVPSPDSFPMEIDFTTSFMTTLSPTSLRDRLPNDGCGFCSNGTPCVCLPNTLPPLQADFTSMIPEAHPEAVRRGGGRKPLADDVKIISGHIPRTGSPMNIASRNGGCTGEPGAFYN
jgi:hypothetical protein